MQNLKNNFKSIAFFSYLVFLIVIFAVSIITLLYSIIEKDETHTFQNGQQTLQVINDNIIKSDFSDWNKTCDWNLIIVNDKNPITEDFKPNLKPYFDTTIDFRVFYYLEEMIRDAETQNIKLWVSSGYRSREKQNQLFEDKIKELIFKGHTLEKANLLVQETIAQPGASEHELGFAVDLNGVKDDFFNSQEYNWLTKNSAKYGFILRYNKEKQKITGKTYEPWHFRYVGEKHARKINEKNMCLEEYVSQLIYHSS